MTNHIVFRSLMATTAIAIGITAATRGPNAGIAWWITLYLTVYPFTHLANRATERNK